MRPGVKLLITKPVVVVDLTAHIIKRLRRVILAGVAARGSAVVYARQWPFAANQYLLADLLVNGEYVNFAQEGITFLRGLFHALLPGGIYCKFCSNRRGRNAV